MSEENKEYDQKVVKVEDMLKVLQDEGKVFNMHEASYYFYSQEVFETFIYNLPKDQSHRCIVDPEAKMLFLFED